MKESARYILPILVFVGLILSFGTSGFLLIEDDISVSDAFYMAVTAITPTQFHEVHELSVRGRYFTVVLVFCGFGAVVAFASQFARLIVASELEGLGVITRKQMSRRIRQMKNHYIVCGYGEIGGAICGQLQKQQIPFVLIAEDAASLDAVERESYAHVRGNPTNDISLKEAGIEHAHGVISVLADDADNLFIALAARELNPKIFIIARGEDSSLEDRILRAGADIVVSPMQLGGLQIAELVRQQAGSSMGKLLATSTNVLGLELTAFQHGEDESTTIASVVAEKNAMSAAAIERHDGSFLPNPSPDDNVLKGDNVILVTRPATLNASTDDKKAGRTILLADDHRALRLLFTRKLSAAGHDVIQANDGYEALRLSLAHSPELVVLDVNMPRPNGYEVCRRLRQMDRFAQVPIILYSGDQTEAFVRRGKEAGADMCIRKSSRSSELLAKIEEAFAQRDRAGAVGQAPAVAGGEPYDLQVILENADGDRELVGEMISVTLKELPSIMSTIDAAVEEADHASVERGAHMMKSAVAIFGASDATKAASSLENAALEKDETRVGQCHQELRRHVENLTEALKAEVLV